MPSSSDNNPLVDLRGVNSVAAVEEKLTRLAELLQSDEHVDLRVPHELKFSFLGGAAAVMQLIGTWARTTGASGALRTYFDPDVTSSDIVTALEKYEHLLLAASVAPVVKDRSGKVDISLLAHDSARSVLRSRRSAGPLRPRRSLLELVCDRWPDLAPFSLYKGGDSRYPRDLKDEYLPLAEGLLSLGSGARSNYPPDVVSSLSWALFELFQNTDQWARSLPSLLGEVPADPSCRLIYGRRHLIPAHRAASVLGETHALRGFLDRLSARDGYFRIFEVTILDMGPGVSAWRAVDRAQTSYTAAEELADIRWALAKRRTTSLDARKGMGYHRAFLNLSRLGGFMLLRSGRVSVSRDFVPSSYPSAREAEDALRPDHERENWTDLDVSPESSPAHASGTRVSFFFPAEASGADL